MNKFYQIDTTLYAGTSGKIELPDGKSWEDIQDWYIRWDTINIKFKDSKEYFAIELASMNDPELVDWKRPISATVFAVGSDGVTDYNNAIDEQ